MKVVHDTTNYDSFKKLIGNREVSEARKKRIRDSIAHVGYITSPIVVNEKLEVIDGQGRLAVLQELGLPVEYVIHEGAGIRECIEMNINQTNWKIIDYIESFAAMGNESYIVLRDAIRKHSRLGLDPVIAALSGSGMRAGENIKKGTFKHDPARQEYTMMALDFLSSVIVDRKSFHGRIWILCLALLYCYGMDNVDKSVLRAQIMKSKDIPSMSTPFVTVMDALMMLEKMYNYNLSKSKKRGIVAQYNNMILQNRQWWEGLGKKQRKNAAN